MYTIQLHCTKKKKGKKRRKKKKRGGKKVTLLHHLQRLIAVRTPHSMQDQTSTKRKVQKILGDYIQLYVQHLGSLLITKGKFTQRRPPTQTYHRCHEKINKIKRTKNKKIINRLFLTI